MALSKIQGAQIETPVDISAVNLTGVTTAAQLNVGTGGTIITTTNAGLVGIGSTLPNTPLDIVRQGTSSILLKSTNTGGALLQLDATGTPGMSNYISFSQNGSGKWALGGQFIGTAAPDSFSLFNYTSYSNPFTITNDNNFGIGITNPTNRFHVGSAPLQMFVVTSGAFVGIGTSTPTSRLQVGAGSTLASENLLLTSGANATLRINHSNTSNNSSDIRFSRDESTKWILGSSNIGPSGGFDDFVLFGGGADYYPLTAKYTSGNIGISNTNPLTRFQVGVTTETFAVTGIGSVGIGTTNPNANLVIRRRHTYNNQYRKIVGIEAFDNANPGGQDVLSIFGHSESVGGLLGFNINEITGNVFYGQPPESGTGVGIMTANANYTQRGAAAITWNNVSVAGKAYRGTSFNIYGEHPNGSNPVTLQHRLMFDAEGNVGIGTTLSGAEFAHYKPRMVLAKEILSGNDDRAAGVFTKAQITDCASTSTTYDVFRFLNKRGSLTSQGLISGWMMVNVASKISGAYQSVYTYVIQSTGNGTADSNYTLAYSVVRGTNPISSIAIANDGVGGAIKLQVTTGSNATISPCFVRVWFIGQADSGMYNTPTLQ